MTEKAQCGILGKWGFTKKKITEEQITKNVLTAHFMVTNRRVNSLSIFHLDWKVIAIRSYQVVQRSKNNGKYPRKRETKRAGLCPYDMRSADYHIKLSSLFFSPLLYQCLFYAGEGDAMDH